MSEKTTMTLNVQGFDAEIIKHAKVYAIKQGKSLKQYLKEAIEEQVNKDYREEKKNNSY